MRAAEDHAPVAYAASVLTSQPLGRGLLEMLTRMTPKSTLAEDRRGGAGGSAPKATRGQGGQGAGAGEPGWCAASTLGGRQGCGAGRDCV